MKTKVTKDYKSVLIASGVERSALISVDLTLNGIVKGSSLDIRTPQFKDMTDDEILSSFESEVFGTNDGLVDALIEMEASNRSKFGPRSLAKAWDERKDATRKYFEYDWPSTDVSFEKSGLKLGKHQLAPWDARRAVMALPNATSTGLPYMKRKGDMREAILQDYKSLLDKELPSMLFTRTQEGGKTRDVWGIGFAQVLQESRFYRPLLAIAKSWNWRAALRSPDDVDEAITALMDRAKVLNHSLVSVDFSSFDQSVSPRLQREAFRAFGSLFQEQFRSELDVINHRFTNVGLITPDGIMEGEHGVPSGSAFTNELDSMAQLLSVRCNHVEATKTPFQIQGDDGAYSTPRPGELFEGFRRAGLAINEDKSVISDTYMVYLQRLYHPAYRNSAGIIGGVYSAYRALNRLVHMERWTDFEREGIIGDNYFAIRAISILENCKHHPRFKLLVQWMAKRDRKGLSFDEHDLIKYIRMIESKGSRDISNQYSDMVRGLMSFETVKILRAM